mmetsp:Transcript_26574/g.89606  ORF Transcript_26574/g.89606 Transcript_26574/m.89606 type:complete len:261 (-) Transcript_26574:990-1772(-)
MGGTRPARAKHAADGLAVVVEGRAREVRPGAGVDHQRGDDPREDAAALPPPLLLPRSRRGAVRLHRRVVDHPRRWPHAADGAPNAQAPRVARLRPAAASRDGGGRRPARRPLQPARAAPPHQHRGEGGGGAARRERVHPALHAHLRPALLRGGEARRRRAGQPAPPLARRGCAPALLRLPRARRVAGASPEALLHRRPLCRLAPLCRLGQPRPAPLWPPHLEQPRRKRPQPDRQLRRQPRHDAAACGGALVAAALAARRL